MIHCLLLYLTFKQFKTVFGNGGVGDGQCYCNNENTKLRGVDGGTCINNVCPRNPKLHECYTVLHKNGHMEKGCIRLTHCFEIKNAHKHENLINCCKGDMCNKNVAKDDLEFIEDYHLLEGTSLPPTKSKEIISIPTAAAIAVPASLIFLLATLFVLYKDRRKKRSMRRIAEENHLLTQRLDEINGINLVDCTTSGSGAGLTLLVQRTIARQVLLHERIGAGRFGSVHRGTWHGQEVAVKIFSSNEEASWFREAQIYQTTMLRHENVLGFIAADNKDTGSCTQLWLVTEYYPLGSLYDFLQEQYLTPRETLKMVYSMINGLCHLHMEVIGTEGKPAMAHRDMKTKNILVKNNKTCAIADLGLTVLHTSINDKVDMPTGTRTGTTRYQAPELLSEIVNFSYFDSYRRADVYAFGLCAWEVCRRTEIDGHVDEYQLPFYDCVQPDPSHEEMKKVVCDENRRPAFAEQWHTEEPMKILVKIMKECWYPKGAARLTSLRIKKNIVAICRELDIKVTY